MFCKSYHQEFAVIVLIFEFLQILIGSTIFTYEYITCKLNSPTVNVNGGDNIYDNTILIVLIEKVDRGVNGHGEQIWVVSTATIASDVNGHDRTNLGFSPADINSGDIAHGQC